MSVIRKYRVSSNKQFNTEFYFKFERDNGNILCNFCIADDGIYYYRAKSQILSPKETNNTRNTPDGFISMEKLSELFESLKRARLLNTDSDGEMIISKSRNKVTIEA